MVPAMERRTANQAIGVAVRARREALGMAQDEFAREVGGDRKDYGEIERGKRNPTLRKLGRICVHLGVAPSMLLADFEAIVGWDELSDEQRLRLFEQ
jgi:transcriptional regulator with XRE-family HTH domain